MTRLLRFVALAMLLFAGRAHGADPVPDYWRGTTDVPDGAKVSLELDKPQAFLGENVLVHFVLQNTGDKPFTFSYGGDYRGASRALRFHLTAIDEKGKLAPDPDPDGSCMGGLGGDHTLEPGKKWYHTLSLPRYATIDQPGTYTLRAWHDLGWLETADRKRPVGEAKITLAMPNPDQVEAILDQMGKPEKNDSWSFGQKRPPYADFGVLRQPVYLAPLEKRLSAVTGRQLEDIIEGIGSIQSTDATALLVRLLEKPANVSNLAARGLVYRLPNNLYERHVPPALRAVRESERKQTWDDKFLPAIRHGAVRMVGESSSESRELGATLLETVGTSDDRNALLDALDDVMLRTEPRAGERANLLDAPGAAQRLLLAIDAIGERSGVLPAPPSTAGELIVCLRKIQHDAKFRPAGWEDVALHALEHLVPYVRECAVRALPVSEAATHAIAKRLEDADHGVVRAACEYATRSKDRSLKPAVLKAAVTVREHFVMGAAHEAATALGAKGEVCEVWASRLDEPKMLMESLSLLATVAKYPGHGTNGNSNVTAEEVAALKARWQAFLPLHRDRINAGQLFEVGNPALTPDLFGRAFSFSLDNNATFPPQEAR